MRGEPKILKTKNLQEDIMKGATAMYEMLATVYGPTSRNVALQKNYGSHVITHDGVTVAKDIIARDQNEDIGMELLYSASKKSNDIAGDGTTLTILLAYHIMKKAQERIAAGFNPIGLKRGIDKASHQLLGELDKLAKPVPKNKLHEIATISASDPDIGKIVADTVSKVGVGVSIEEFEGVGVIQDIIDGTYIEKGFAHPYFMNEPQREEAVHENINVLIMENRVRDNQEILPILETAYKELEHKAVLIIGNITGKALDSCILTQHKGKIRVLVVNPPVYANMLLPFLEDIATITGAKVVPQNMPAAKVTADYLGFARKVVSTRQETTIFGGAGNKEDLDLRIDTLKKQLKSDKYTAPEKERMEKRLSKLEGKIARIKVGGATEPERNETLFRVEDAVNATKAAAEEGVVPGGATTLARLGQLDYGQDVLVLPKDAKVEGDRITTTSDPQSVQKIKVPGSLTKDEQEGVRIVFESLQEPFRQLMINAGEDPGYRLQQVLRGNPNHGFNVKEMSEDPVDLVKAGVIDPVKVIKSAVENSCSVAGLGITLGGATQIDRAWQLEQIQMNKAGIGQ